MKAIDILVDEHDYILKMISIAEEILQTDDYLTVDINHVESIVDFVKNFADKCHHLKEEDILFMEMEKSGMSREDGPIAVMLNEHNEGRVFIKQAQTGIELFKQGYISSFLQIQENLLNYCQLLTQHIGKENNILYPMAERILPVNVGQDMTTQFEHINVSTPQNEYHDKYIKMVEELGEIYLEKAP